MKGWNLKMGLPNHLCLVKSWLRFACQLQLAKLCFQTESQLLINSLCKWIWHSLEILAVSSNQDIRIYKIYCIFVIGIHVELRLFGYSDFSWNIQICNLYQYCFLFDFCRHNSKRQYAQRRWRQSVFQSSPVRYFTTGGREGQGQHTVKILEKSLDTISYLFSLLFFFSFHPIL